MKQQDQDDEQSQGDVSRDDGDDPASAEFVPLLKQADAAENSAGAVDAAIRWQTDAVPLHSDVSRANRTGTTAAS